MEEAELSRLNYSEELFKAIPGTAFFPDCKLALEEGYMVVFLRNLQPKNGHANGICCTFEKMKRNTLFTQASTGSRDGTRLILPRNPCSPGDDDL